MVEISFVILTKNNEETIDQALTSTKDFAEVIVVDSGSHDQTLRIAKRYSHVKIYERPFTNFSDQRNFGAGKASFDWIFQLDSDEQLTFELIDELKKATLDPKTIYGIPFRNFFHGQEIRYGGWYPDIHRRLYNRKETHFVPSHFVHEDLEKEGMKIASTKGHIIHYSYRDFHHFIDKMQFYTDLFAEQHKGKRKSSYSKALGKSVYMFFRTYIFRRGFLDGWLGFFIAFYQAQTSFFKYIKLYEKNRFLQKGINSIQMEASNESQGIDGTSS